MKTFRIFAPIATPLILMGLSGCMLGPSTKVNTVVPSVGVRSGENTSSASRVFLDSLRRARAADAPDSMTRITTQSAPALLEVSSGATSLAWTDVLRDAVLDSLIRTAVANNRNLRVAQARINEYRALRGVAGSRLFPQLTANTSIATNKVALAASSPIEFDAARVTADLAWELDFWGRTRRGGRGRRV